MQQFLSRLRQSASIKVITIGFLVLVLLIPLAMVRDTIHDRNSVHQSARHEIQRTWGQSQTIAGPVLVLPFDTAHVNNHGERYVRHTEMYILPELLEIDAAIDSEIRYRGIHKVPVYSARIQLSGRFAPIDTRALGIDGASVRWAEAYVVLGVSDGRAITETPSLILNDQSVAFAPGGTLVAGLPPQVQAPLGDQLTRGRDEALEFSTTVHLKGSESLYLLPLGDTTRASMRSAWASPSFAGNYLPETRSITDEGFEADWRVSSIGRTLPSYWQKDTNKADSAALSAFGVELYMPISIYRLTLRAATYGVLFIVLTFVTYFLFEIVAGLRLHPLQYLMVGMANVVFFLLLIALAEHIGFGAAYFASALASSGLIVGYSASVLGQRRRALIIGSVLFVLYGFLYMTLKAETYALLAGSLGLWAALALIMYLTRRIDWYGRAKADPEDDPQQSLAV